MDLCSFPDDVLLRLVDYLEQEDCLCLALSSKKLCSLFGQYLQFKRCLNFERCYLLTTDLWTSLMQHLNLQCIRRFNVAGCSWLPVDCLLEAIHQMSDLEELLVNDTRVTVEDLWAIFPRCPNIQKLSFTFQNKNLADREELYRLIKRMEYDEDTEALQNGFHRITSLKMTCPDTADVTFWAVFVILKWCASIEHLHIEWNLSLMDSYSIRNMEKCFTPSSNFNQLLRIKDLRSFVLIGRKGTFAAGTWIAILFLMIRISKPQLEQLCIAYPRPHFGASILGLEGPKFLFKTVDPPTGVNVFANELQCGHVLDVCDFQESSELRSCNVRCSNISEWRTICLKHPNLEELHFQYGGFFVGYDDKFRLPKLRILEIEPNYSRMIRSFVSACPDVRELIVGHEKCERSLDDYEARHIIRWKKLKILRVSACGLALEPLKLILEGCKELECLHIYSKLKNAVSMYQFTFGLYHLSLPDNIRELAIRWSCEPCKCNTSSPIRFLNGSPIQEKMSLGNLLALATKWQHLRVLIIHKERVHLRDIDQVVERVTRPIAELKALRYLALIGPFETDLIEAVKQAVKERIQLNGRPYFRFYIGPALGSTYYPYE